MTRFEIETALDEGRLSILMANGRYWKARRNGRTQTWKTRPTDFRIPEKAGFRAFAQITETWLLLGNSSLYKIEATDAPLEARDNAPPNVARNM